MTSGPAAQPPGPGVRVQGLRKRYGDTVALDGLDLVAEPGEILGIAGPNGAGKSTLVRILAGETAADAGSVEIGGRAMSQDLAAEEVAIVHQEPELFPNLTVGENLLVGREPGRFLQRGIGPRERDVLASLHIDHLAGQLLGSVPLAVQQRTEIARALVRERSVFLFDEPNSALTEDESDDLFARMHRLADAGHVVLLVSHRLEELARHTDRVVMVVDGRATVTLAGDEKTHERIAEELVTGHVGSRDTRATTSGVVTDLLTLSGWSHPSGRFRDVGLPVPAGQVTAVVGVEGSGARELVRSVAGLEPAVGDLRMEGVPQRGVFGATSFVGADRSDSLFGNLSVGENMAVRLLQPVRGRFGLLDRDAVRRVAEEARGRFSVKTASLDQPIRDLSGGNQQKVAIASAMVTRPRVIVLEEPTRGVDVGSKAEIYGHLRSYAEEGNAVLLFCTEDSEVFEAADVVHVVARGQLSEPVQVADHGTVQELATRLARIEGSIGIRAAEQTQGTDRRSAQS